MDYVTDFLIGPRETEADKSAAGAKLATNGNSGAVWFLEQRAAEGENEGKRRLRPIALHWGSQTFVVGGEVETQFALATSLGTICRELEVEIVRDVNIGLPETWGKVGHYKIGQIACKLASDKDLDKLLQANLDRVSFADDDIADLKTALNRSKFVALADVPDIVWKGTEAKRGRESPNHFADMDQRSPKFKKTLLDFTTGPQILDPSKWIEFYESLGVEKAHMGLLPFRVWQLFDVMKEALDGKDLDRYVCAAGVLAHYVGDACQPLHVSMYHDGDPDSGEGKGIHSAYETQMLDRHAVELNEKVNALVQPPPQLHQIADGRAAAWAVVGLMRRSITAIDPQDMIRFYEQHTGQGRPQALWDEYGDATAERMADGATVLASIWEGAWLASQTAFPTTELVGRNKNGLRSIYRDRDFAPSVYLTMMSLENSRLVVNMDE